MNIGTTLQTSNLICQSDSLPKYFPVIFSVHGNIKLLYVGMCVLCVSVSVCPVIMCIYYITQFLCDQDGTPVKRFAPTDDPLVSCTICLYVWLVLCENELQYTYLTWLFHNTQHIVKVNYKQEEVW